MANTKIEWADLTINPIVGCNPASDGCKNCYASRMFKRQKGMGTRLYKDMQNFSDVAWDVNILEESLKKIKGSKRIFLCSMSDMFHEKVDDYIINNILDICKNYPQHDFLILTKRYQRLDKFIWCREFPKNIHFGISICNNKDLKKAVYDKSYWESLFVSFEPLLEKLDSEMLNHLFEDEQVNWAIVGAETGPGHREFEEQWGLDILNKARKYKIPYFFKKRYLTNGSKTDIIGGVRIQEFPKDN